MSVHDGLCQNWTGTKIVGFLMRRLICIHVYQLSYKPVFLKDFLACTTTMGLDLPSVLCRAALQSVSVLKTMKANLQMDITHL